jgi:hypothetical protein
MEGEIMGSESALEAVRQAEQKYRSISEHCVIGTFQTNHRVLAVDIFFVSVRQDFVPSPRYINST